MVCTCRVLGEGHPIHLNYSGSDLRTGLEGNMQKLRFLTILILMPILGLSNWAAKPPQDKNKLMELKKGIELFESVLKQSLAQTFGGPFETLNQARGAYLPKYGVVFSFEVNLTPLQNLGPFSQAPTAKEEKGQLLEENRRREKAVSVAEQTLGDYSQSLSVLEPGESVAIVIQTVAAHPSKIERTTIVISADKNLLLARQNQSLDQAHFVQKLSKMEY
jgi:hypothetical protein